MTPLTLAASDGPGGAGGAGGVRRPKTFAGALALAVASGGGAALSKSTFTPFRARAQHFAVVLRFRGAHHV
eukprot:14238122-Alexandrium_andersonii.AAC.1